MSEQSVLVVGATGGLGADVIRTLSTPDLTVHFTGRRPERVEELQQQFPGTIGHTVDAIEEGAIRGVIEAVDKDHPLAAYVHLAGGYSGGRRIDELTDENWERMCDSNWMTLRHGAAVALGIMRRRKAGSIVTVGALPAIHGSIGAAPYDVAKAAVIAFTRCLAEEGKSCGIRANCIVPGILNTPANRKAMPDGDTDAWITTERVASVIAFLCSPGSEGVSGSTILMRGRV